MASDGAGTDEFGSSISIYDNTIAVGARDDNTDGGGDAGNAIYIYIHIYVHIYVHEYAYIR